MKKIIIKFLLIISIIFGIFSISNTNGGYVNIPASGNIPNSSISSSSNGDIVGTVNRVGKNILKSVKLIVQALAVLFVVYIGIQMIISKGEDQEELNKAKKQILYTVMGLAFINMPGILYEAFNPNMSGTINSGVPATSWTSNSNYNILFNTFDFGYTLNNNIIGFMQILIAGVAILVLAYAGLKIMISRGREDKITEGKNKIRYSILALLFVGFIESWKKFVFFGNINDGTGIFKTMLNLSLFLIGPVVILFLTIAGYYYITSDGDDEKIKKAKSIIVNVLIASILLLASYTFLLDLQKF